MTSPTCAPAVPGAITNLNYALLRASLSGLDASAPGIFLSPLSVYYALALALNGAGEAHAHDHWAANRSWDTQDSIAI
eukprot:364924-Chlamydomonas_euryale.AAC.2